MKLSRMLFTVALTLGAVSVTDAQQLSKRDQLRIGVQEICPISGNKLGEHGDPIKVQVGKETVFLCCKGCLQGQIKPKLWATIHANFAKAQGRCPVMKHELPSNPKWTIVQGQIVYVCCPPCTRKIAREPEKYLQMIDRYYEEAIQRRGQ